MSASAPVPAPEPSPKTQPPFDATREVLAFLRSENEANRAALREDADKNRKLLTDTIRFTAYPLAAIIAVAAFFGWRSLADLKTSIRTEARSETKTEIVRMQGEIREKLQAQFQTPALQKMVREAAEDQTRKAAEPLITSEVEKQVKTRVNAEEPTIVAEVTRQTQAAVKQMKPDIDSLVKKTVSVNIQENVAPVETSLKGLKADADLQRTIIRMNNDDAIAFDQLMVFVSSTSDEATKQLVTGALKDAIDAHNDALRIGWTFTAPHTEDQMINELSSPDVSVRKTALSMLASNSKLSTSRVVEIAANDASLNVRCEAGRIFDDRTKQHFKCLAGHRILARWWEANKQNFPDQK
jgi:hypothetical protein